MPKERLDVLLVQRGLSESREQAQRLIRSGTVRIAGQVHTKPGHTYAPDVEISVDEADRFVSRGGEKLEGAFEAFELDVAGQVCLDVGASTGGFTDCLLQHGAAKVYAVDVGKGQLHWKLRQDPRVVVMERINARALSPEQFPEQPAFAVADVSFISLTKILPAMDKVLAPGSGILTLVKPQFEAGREKVGKGGVVRDGAVHEEVLAGIRDFGTSTVGWECKGVCESPLRGPAGNKEFLVWWAKA